MNRIVIYLICLLLFTPFFAQAEEQSNWGSLNELIRDIKDHEAYIKENAQYKKGTKRDEFIKEELKRYDNFNKRIKKIFTKGETHSFKKDCPLELVKQSEGKSYFIPSCLWAYYSLNVSMPFALQTDKKVSENSLPVGTIFIGKIKVTEIESVNYQPRIQGAIKFHFIQKTLISQPKLEDIDPKTGLIKMSVIKSCEKDSDCGRVTNDCCSCSSGGSGDFGINRKYSSYWSKHYPHRDCRGVMCPTVYKCYGKTRCVDNQCEY